MIENCTNCGCDCHRPVCGRWKHKNENRIIKIAEKYMQGFNYQFFLKEINDDKKE